MGLALVHIGCQGKKLLQYTVSREQKHVSISDTPMLLIEINSISNIIVTIVSINNVTRLLGTNYWVLMAGAHHCAFFSEKTLLTFRFSSFSTRIQCSSRKHASGASFTLIE